MRLVIGWGKPGYRIYFFEISDYIRIAFFEWPGVKPIQEKDAGVAVKGPVAFDHVSLGLETEDDLWILKDKLDSAGLWVSEVIYHGFIHSIYSFDPNGIPVEFSCNVKEFDVRKTPVMADPDPSETAREGDDPNAGIWPTVQRPTPVQDRRIYPGEGRRYFKRLKT